MKVERTSAVCAQTNDVDATITEAGLTVRLLRDGDCHHFGGAIDLVDASGPIDIVVNICCRLDEVERQ